MTYKPTHPTPKTHPIVVEIIKAKNAMQLPTERLCEAVRCDSETFRGYVRGERAMRFDILESMAEMVGVEIMARVKV
jgi:hypothetical protein